MYGIVAIITQAAYAAAIARLEWEAAAAALQNPPPGSAVPTEREVWLKAKAMDDAYAESASLQKHLLPPKWEGAGPDPGPVPEVGE